MRRLRWALVHDDGPVHAWPPDQVGSLWESLCGLARAEPTQLREGDERCLLCRVMLGGGRQIHIPVERWMT